VGAQLFHADGWKDRETDRQTDMMKLIVAFLCFVDSPKNYLGIKYQCLVWISQGRIK